MNIYKEYLASPCGTLVIEADDEAIISIKLLPAGKVAEEGNKTNIFTELCCMQINEYFKGDRRTFDFPYRLNGTEFQNTVWAEIAKIPHGETISCNDLAERLNKPQAVRSIAEAANECNIMFAIPCHRIVGGEGALSSFSAGAKVQEQLLEFEKEPQYYTKFNFADAQRRRGKLPTNRITGRFIYDITDTVFETEQDEVLSAHKTHTFPVGFSLEGCSGFTLEADAFMVKEYEPVDVLKQEVVITFYNASETFVTKAILSPGENKLHYDINDMTFTNVYKVSIFSAKPLRNVKISKLNVLDNYFRYKGQVPFYTTNGCTLTEKDYTLVCGIDGKAQLESYVFPDSKDFAYNMKMPIRNTIFVVLKNMSTATKMKLYYKTTVNTEYCEENSVELPISRSPEYKAYYFNLSATPGLEGRLMQFMLETNGTGEIVIREYSFEEEKVIAENAGNITSCVAKNDIISLTGYVTPSYIVDGAMVSVYATAMRNDKPGPEGKEFLIEVPLAEAVNGTLKDGSAQFSVTGIPFQNGPITRLSSQFVAFITIGEKIIPIGERFYIENYEDFQTNPYSFELPDYSVCVTDAPFNAKGDGCTDDTDAIQAAIDAVWKQGGGKIIIPGPTAEDDKATQFYGRRFRITNILLRSRTELHFEDGAILWQSPIYRDYKYIPDYGHDIDIGGITWSHGFLVSNLPTVQCADSEYVKITGFGKIRSYDTGSEEGVVMPFYSTGCADRIHQVPIAFYQVNYVELKDFELVRTNNYHAPIYGCRYVYAANMKLHEVRCVSGDGFGLSRGTHHAVLNRNFFQSNDDGVVLGGCYFDPRGLVWWKSRLGKHGGTRHVKIVHSYMNSGGGKAIAFIPWGTSDPNIEMQEISDITVYDNYLVSVNPVGAWYDNPYNGKFPFDNSETDDYSPIKSVRVFNNIYEGDTNIGPIQATDFITDCNIHSTSDFRNGDFELSKIPGLANWSYKLNKNKNSVKMRYINGRYCGVMQHFNEGDTALYQGLFLRAGAHKCSFDMITGETGAYIFAQNIRTGEIIAEKHVVALGDFDRLDIKFNLSEDTDLYIGLRHPADTTSADEFVALDKAKVESVEV